MGCTLSKQVDASREDSEGSENDASKTDQGSFKDNSLNGNSNNSTSNGSFTEKSKNSKKNLNVEAKVGKGRPVLTSSKSEKKCTQSQLDFFEMLDRKIDAGPDYISEDEKVSRTISDSRYNEKTPSSRTSSLVPVEQA